MELAGFENIPIAGKTLVEHKEKVRIQLLRLNDIVDAYNSIMTSCTDVEVKLLQPQMSSIEKMVEEGFTTLRWIDTGNYF